MSLPWYAVAVDHDPSTAAAAAAGLTLAAAAVGDAVGTLDDGVPLATDDWSGRARAVFDAEAPTVVEAGYGLLAALLDAAAAVNARSQAAADEAARRAAVSEQRSAEAQGFARFEPLFAGA